MSDDNSGERRGFVLFVDAPEHTPTMVLLLLIETLAKTAISNPSPLTLRAMNRAIKRLYARRLEDTCTINQVRDVLADAGLLE